MNCHSVKATRLGHDKADNRAQRPIFAGRLLAAAASPRRSPQPVGGAALPLSPLAAPATSRRRPARVQDILAHSFQGQLGSRHHFQIQRTALSMHS